MKPLRTGLVVVAVLVAACGGDEPPRATCHPGGTSLSITADNLEFDTECLAVSPDEAFTIDFDNADQGTQHNVAIYDGDQSLFRGDIIDGGDSTTYEVGPLAEGTYTFRCDVHPQMDGAFVVEPIEG
jgi:plastocyanin